jgi:hypothetical protein
MSEHGRGNSFNVKEREDGRGNTMAIGRTNKGKANANMERSEGDRGRMNDVTLTIISDGSCSSNNIIGENYNRRHKNVWRHQQIV